MADPTVHSAPSGYALAISLLIAAFVRHHQDDGQRVDADASLLSEFNDDDGSRKSLARASVHGLARFLCREIQRPPLSASRHQDPTSLHAVFQRLDAAIAVKDDAATLMEELLAVLQRVDSPDAVSDIVDAIHDLLGVFVRRFVLSVHRLLFDGLSRLYDQVVVYRELYTRDPHPQRGRAQRPRQPSAHDRSDLSICITASPASGFLWKDSGDMDELPLSPIASASTATAAEAPTLQLSSSALDASSSSSLLSPPQRPRPHAPASLSHDQLQFMLHDHVVDVERGRTFDTTSRRRPSLDRSASSPDALFATYLDAVARREFDTALDALHQYHDVALASTMRLRRALRAAAASAAAAAASTTTNGAPTAASASATRLHFLGSGVQYAALNLAGLNLAFDRLSAASDSLQEAIRVAQHHGDHICVAIALAWLIRVHQAQGHSQPQVAALLTSALERAEQLGLPSLQALAVFAAIDDELQRSPSGVSPSLLAGAVVAQVPQPRPLSVWSQLASVDAAVRQMGDRVPSLSLHAIGAGAGGGAAAGAGGHAAVAAAAAGRSLGVGIGGAQQSRFASDGSGIKWRQSVENVLRSMWRLSSRACVLAAVSWRQLGSRELSSALDGVFWSVYHSHASVAELAAWICRCVQLQVERGTDDDDKQDKRTRPHETETPAEITFVAALRYLIHLVRRVSNATASRDRATDMTRLLLQQRSVQRTIHELLARWSCLRGEWVVAHAHVESVRALSPAHSDMPTHLESALLLAELHGASGSVVSCLELLERLEATCRQRSYTRLLARVLLLRARTKLQTSGPTEALPAVAAAIALCRTHHWDLLLADAHVVMAEIYIAMGRAGDAIALLDGQMGVVTEHGALRLRADALLTLARARLARCRHASTTSALDARVRSLLQESELLFRQLDCWSRLQEIAFLRASLARFLADANAAVEHATSFLHSARSSQTSAPTRSRDSSA
ncbi:hypothetical protein PINS_up011773 [Pythium insidiosum]|nr:hypothetical protein PINS_up011773 [Pythium insidiosum]